MGTSIATSIAAMPQHERLSRLLNWILDQANDEKMIITNSMNAITDVLQPTLKDKSIDPSNSTFRTCISQPSLFVPDRSSTIQEAHTSCPPSVISYLELPPPALGTQTVLEPFTLYIETSCLSLASAMSTEKDEIAIEDHRVLALQRLEGRVPDADINPDHIDEWVDQQGLRGSVFDRGTRFGSSPTPPSPSPPTQEQLPQRPLRRIQGIFNLRLAAQMYADIDAIPHVNCNDNSTERIQSWALPPPLAIPPNHLASLESESPLSLWPDLSETAASTAATPLQCPVAHVKKWPQDANAMMEAPPIEAPQKSGRMRRFVRRVVPQLR